MKGNKFFGNILNACKKLFPFGGAVKNISESTEDFENRTSAIIREYDFKTKLNDHYNRADNLKVPDYDETESRAISILGDGFAKEIVLNNDRSHMLLYHLGKNLNKAKELATIYKTDSSTGIAKIDALEQQIMRNIRPRRPRAPNPEISIPPGNRIRIHKRKKLKTRSITDTDKIGKPEKRVQALRQVISKMLENGDFLENDTRWPRTKIWEEAVKEKPELFPNIKDDERDGVFAKAYICVKKEYT